MSFYDSFGDNGSETYVRNEEKSVRKTLLIMGINIDFPITKNLSLIGDLYIGGGQRRVVRDIDNIRFISEDNVGEQYILEDPPDEIRKFDGTSLIIGLHIGISYSF